MTTEEINGHQEADGLIYFIQLRPFFFWSFSLNAALNLRTDALCPPWDGVLTLAGLEAILGGGHEGMAFVACEQGPSTSKNECRHAFFGRDATPALFDIILVAS